MFLTPHTAVALWITTKTDNPFLAFIYGIISHFILDIIPHGDESFAKHKGTQKEKVIYMLKVGIVDILLTMVLIYLFITKYTQAFQYNVLVGAVSGAALPDIMWLSIETFKLRFLSWYVRLHSRLHHLIKSRYSFVYGIPFQMFFTLLIMKIIF